MFIFQENTHTLCIAIPDTSIPFSTSQFKKERERKGRKEGRKEWREGGKKERPSLCYYNFRGLAILEGSWNEGWGAANWIINKGLATLDCREPSVSENPREFGLMVPWQWITLINNVLPVFPWQCSGIGMGISSGQTCQPSVSIATCQLCNTNTLNYTSLQTFTTLKCNKRERSDETLKVIGMNLSLNGPYF